MSPLAAWIHSPFAQALGWALAHFVWEGAVLAIILLAALRIFRGSPARRRYALACAILAVMPLAFGATLAVMWARQPAPVPMPALVLSPVLELSVTAVPDIPAPPRFTIEGFVYRLAWMVPLWFAGVIFFYVRGMAGWVAVQRLRSRGVCAVAPEWQARLDKLAARMRLSRPVALLESCFTDTPVLIGYLRPVVLLPLGCLTGLSGAQLECILLHELAHVGRHDYIVNLLQSVVEGLLFYHPAVWWVSSVVRAERENCCDDAVVELVGDARSYAATLAALEHRRAMAPRPALAASGGHLIKRIRRLTMESRRAQTSRALPASAALLLAAFAASLAALPAELPLPRHPRPAGMFAGIPLDVPRPRLANLADQVVDDPQDEFANPYEKWINQEVVYIVTDEERASFLALATDLARDNFIEQFWLKRDPKPGTAVNEFKQEHYRRLAYVNEHFSAQVAGWKTDRGRIYIIYGAPDAIEDHSLDGKFRQAPAAGAGETASYPFQRWHYRYIDGIGSNIVMEFVDPTGSGDFHLTLGPSEKEDVFGRKPQVASASAGLVDQGYVKLAPGAQRIRASNGVELQVMLPVVNAPFRVYFAYAGASSNNQQAAPERPKPDRKLVDYMVTAEEREAFLNLQSNARAAANNQQSAPERPVATPYRKWLNEDVFYLITDEERAAFLKLQSDAEREAFIDSFWKKRDPTPDTVLNEFKEEHYRRIEYANQHFSTGLPGWKTDRGRIYITYGPPNEEHVNGRSVSWMYRFIDGVGSNVLVDFEDPNGTGEYRMTSAPHQSPAPGKEQAAKVFVGPKNLAVSVIVPGPSHASPSGTIGAGDVLEVEHTAPASVVRQTVVNLDSAIAAKDAECDALLRKYQPAFPGAMACQEQKRQLEERRSEVEREGAGTSLTPQATLELARLRSDHQTLTAQLQATLLDTDNKARQAGEITVQLKKAQEQAAVSPANINEVNRLTALLVSLNNEVAQEKQHRALLEAEISNNKNLQSVVQTTFTTVERRSTSLAPVRLDGKITVNAAGDTVAAGLTATQVQASLGPGYTVRIHQAAPEKGQNVTVLVPLDTAAKTSHVFAQVTTGSHAPVATFETDVAGRPAAAHNFLLTAGTYHLAVTVRNTGTGRERKSELDFTVE